MNETAFPSGKLITCILKKGAANPIMKKLREEMGISSMSFHHARGAGRSGATRQGLGHYVEHHIVTIAVDTQKADDVFEFIYHEAKIGEGHNGLLLMERLDMVTPYTLPEELEEE